MEYINQFLERSWEFLKTTIGLILERSWEFLKTTKGLISIMGFIFILAVYVGIMNGINYFFRALIFILPYAVILLYQRKKMIEIDKKLQK